ncbi:hypothetical protein OAB94_00945 [Flavobacteriaceae bacterium]|jgi:hypothetical protein|nr:hypothetical protein [Flavobacteriaceae bacterium]
MQPSEIEEMFYYEYWYYVKNLQEHIKSKNKQQMDQQEHAESQRSSFKTPQMPKAPNMSSFKAPSMKMPKMG